MPLHTFTALVLLLAACVAMRRANEDGSQDAALWAMVLFMAFAVYL